MYLYLFVFKSIGSSIDIRFYRVSFVGCSFLFACLLVYVILTTKKAFEKLVVGQYGKLLLTRTCPYQLLLLQNLFSYMELKECLLPKSAL